MYQPETGCDEGIGGQTFAESDLSGDGTISHEDWNTLSKKHPHLLKNMTLDALRCVPLC